jgi:hypothetical protein
MKIIADAQKKRASARHIRRILVASSLLALFVAFALPSRAQTKTALPKNEDCFMCHGDPSLKNNKGKLIFVDQEAFDKSIHAKAGMTCIRCHTDFLAAPELPHISLLEPVSCKTCHAGMTAGVAGPVAHTVRKEPRTFAARFVKIFYIVAIIFMMSAFLVYIGADLFRRRRNA